MPQLRAKFKQLFSPHAYSLTLATFQTIKLVFGATPLSLQHWGVRAKTGLFGIRIMCPSGATYLHLDCCTSEQAWSSAKWTPLSPHRNVTYSRHDIAEKLLNRCKTMITHLLTPIWNRAPFKGKCYGLNKLAWKFKWQ